MSKIATQFTKNQIITLLLFLIFLVSGNIMLKILFTNQAENEIRIVKEFLLEEAEEDEYETLEEFYEDIVSETPKLKELYISFLDEDKNLTYENARVFDKEPLDTLFKEDNYLILNLELKPQKIEKINVQIIKNTNDLLHFLSIVREISFLGYLFILFISGALQYRLYRKMVKQFRGIKSITSKVNLGNFDVEIDDKEFFEEFSIVLKAYEKMLDRLNKQMNTQVEFVQNASHELRTPIQIISGYTNLIDRWGYEEEKVMKDSLESIKSELSNINSLIEKLMFLAKQDYLKLEKEKFSIKELVGDINYEMSIIYPEAKLIASGDDIKFESDIDLFKQLIRNLVKNGIVYSNKGEVKTEYYVDKSKLKIKISDNGVGLDSEQLDRIFDKFYRVDKSRSRKEAGHGLGLAIVKTILDILNGDIYISSAPNSGTIIVLTFDLKEIN